MIKNYFLLVIFFFALTLAGCKKEEWDPTQTPDKPEDKEFDLNGDQIKDFKLVYRNWTWDGNITSGDMITGELVPENNNQILIHPDLGLLFVQLNDTIFNQIESPFIWETSSYFLLSIKSTNPTGWEREWSVKNNVKKEFYYLSFKISVDNRENLGWIKMNINHLTGQIEITDKQLTDQDYIVVDR